MIPMVTEIQFAVCQYYGLSFAELLGPCRERRVARPRQIGMYLAREMTVVSLPEIGRRFGGRDHTTVIHGVSAIRRLRRTIPEINREVGHVREIASQIAARRNGEAA